VKIFTIRVAIQGKDYDEVTAQLAIIERACLAVFCFTDPKGQESDHQAARNAMDSLHFLDGQTDCCGRLAPVCTDAISLALDEPR
jgi:hypothetical protein